MAPATVYVATNIVNGKQYVGLTRFKPSHRWTQHVYKAARKPTTYFHHAINKYGADSFLVEPVASCLSVDDAWAVERQLIQRLKPDYNQTNGGEFTVGRHRSAEVAERVRLANIGRKRTLEQRAKMSASRKAWMGKDPSHRVQVAEAAAKGRAFIDHDKRKAAAAAEAHSREWSAESRAKLSASCMGRVYGRDVIDRMRAKKNKAVECVETGQVFVSMLAAAAATGVHVSSVSRVILGKRKCAGGLTFRLASH